ncbi:MAG: DUF255 domain-containing protein [Bacteroidota bacterium]
MKIIKTSLLTVLLCLFAVSSYAQVKFIDKSWEDAKALAKQDNKLIFIDCFTDWCGWCKVMDKETFSNEEVGEFMNSHFVPLKIDMERGWGVKLAMKYHVRGFPTFLFFDSDGKLIYQVVGFHKPEIWMPVLKKACDPKEQFNNSGFSNKIEMNYPDFYGKAFLKGEEKVIPKQSVVDEYLEKQTDLFSEVNWAVMSIFETNAKFEKHFLDNIDKYTELFGKSQTNTKVQGIIYDKLDAGIKTEDETKLDDIDKLIDKYMPENADMVKLNFRQAFYERTENWKKYAEISENYITKNEFAEVSVVNEICWKIYEKIDDKEIINKAVGWMKTVTDNAPIYMYLDTYAALLYKSGNIKEAEKSANMALQTGKANKEDVKETEKLIEKIKKAKKGKK